MGGGGGGGGVGVRAHFHAALQHLCRVHAAGDLKASPWVQKTAKAISMHTGFDSIQSIIYCL
jgi:hypothetical protein